MYVENNQIVHAGDPLVDFDPRDFQVALDQSQAALNQARSQVTAQQPNIPITQVENTANISTSEAGVTTAQAVLAAAEHDRPDTSRRTSFRSGSEQRQSASEPDLARYKILIANEEVSRQEYDR